MASLLAFQQSHVVDFLLGNGLSVRKLEAVEIDVFVRVVALVHLVEYLPRDVVVYLLLHFLVLLERYLLIDIGLVLARLVLLVDLLLEVLTYFFVLVNCLDLPLLFHLSLVHAIGLLAHRHYGRVLPLQVGIVNVLSDNLLRPKIMRSARLGSL